MHNSLADMYQELIIKKDKNIEELSDVIKSQKKKDKKKKLLNLPKTDKDMTFQDDIDTIKQALNDLKCTFLDLSKTEK